MVHKYTGVDSFKTSPKNPHEILALFPSTNVVQLLNSQLVMEKLSSFSEDAWSYRFLNSFK